MEDLLETLSKLSVTELETVFEAAKRRQFKNKKAKVPFELVERFKAASKTVSKGQSFIFSFTVPLEFQLVVKAEHEFGHVSDWKLKIFPELSTDPKMVSWFENTFKESINYTLMEDCFSLERISPDVIKACEEETKAFKNLQKIRMEIRDNYGVEAFDLLEETE